MQEGNCYTAYWDKLSQISDAAQIGKVFASPFDGVLDSGRIEQANEDMFNIVSNYDYLYQRVVVDPQNDNTFIQADKMSKNTKRVGIKIHPLCHKYYIEEYGVQIFFFASIVYIAYHSWITNNVSILLI